MTLRRLAAAPFLMLALLAGCQAEPQPPGNIVAAVSQTRLLPVTVVTKTGIRQLRVEVADTPAAQERGLMFRTALPEDGGMLFTFEPPQIASFWMKNMIIPLDIIFIRLDSTIASIATNMPPYVLDSLIAPEPVKAVLELTGGTAAKLGIEAGDTVGWK